MLLYTFHALRFHIFVCFCTLCVFLVLSKMKLYLARVCFSVHFIVYTCICNFVFPS